MRTVRCKITGEIGNSDTFYKAPNRKYYKTKEIYDKSIEDKGYVVKIFEFINRNILHMTFGHGSNNSLIMKQLNELGLDYKVVLSTLQENCDSIRSYLSDKTDATIASKIFMIFNFVFKHNNMKITYSGAYAIENKYTHAVYIGESIDIFSRFTQHVDDLYNNRHHCEKLQNAFNETHCITNFNFYPLYLLPIVSKDKKTEKEETLYLEAAFYLKYKSEKRELYNTINPYVTLKNGNAKYNNSENIDAKDVLKKIYSDKDKILPTKLLKIVRKDLEDIIELSDITSTPNITSTIDCKTNNTDKIVNKSQIKSKKNENSNRFNFTSVIEECQNDGILPENYDYSKVRQKLTIEGIIYIDENNRTVATKDSLNNNWFILRSDNVDKNGVRKRLYYISETGKTQIKKALSKYDKNNYLA